MKKRSLVAAIAMLVVSAIVLTSSTYAWFASNGNGQVDGMSATVTNNDGTLTLVATVAAANASMDPVTHLTSAHYNSTINNLTALNPVSMSFNSSGAPSFYKVTYTGEKFTGGSAAGENTDYKHWGFDVTYANGATAAKRVSMTPTWAGSNFIYGLVKVTVNSTTTYYMFQAAGQYTPVTAVNGDITDAKTGTGAKVDVIDDTDTDHANATMGSYSSNVTAATSGTAITFDAAASSTTTANVECWIWAEGQDENCTGITATDNGSLSFATITVGNITTGG